MICYMLVKCKDYVPMLNFFKKKDETKKTGLIGGLKNGLAKTRASIIEGTKKLLSTNSIDQESLQELKIGLLRADVGVQLANDIIQKLQDQMSSDATAELLAVLKNIILEIIEPLAVPLQFDRDQNKVILLVGINGAGKTTTIGKLAKKIKARDLSCLIAAGDTFRAGAIEQVSVWGERNDIEVISQNHGADPAAIAHDAVVAAKARQLDVTLIDTAGRLHTQENLMQELAKVVRVIGKVDSNAPHETLLVIDASIGQNALLQAREFHEAIGITGLVVTKLDGTAKGGVLIKIAKELQIPIRYIGVGEGIDDLIEFNANDYVNALLDL